MSPERTACEMPMWFDYAIRRNKVYVDGKSMELNPKKRWMDLVKENLTEKGLNVQMTQDTGRWRRYVKNSDPE